MGTHETGDAGDAPDDHPFEPPLDDEIALMNEEAIRNLGILPMPDWEQTNSKAKSLAAEYKKPVIKSLLNALDIALLTFQKRHAISPSAMKELDEILVSLIEEVSIRGNWR